MIPAPYRSWRPRELQMVSSGRGSFPHTSYARNRCAKTSDVVPKPSQRFFSHLLLFLGGGFHKIPVDKQSREASPTILSVCHVLRCEKACPTSVTALVIRKMPAR